MNIKKEKVFIGVDPGKTGAVVSVYNDSFLIFDTPVTKEKGITDYDIIKMVSVIQNSIDDSDLYDISFEAVVCMEDVHAFRGDSVVGSFSFGRGVGIWDTIISLYIAKENIHKVSPQVWKKYFGLYGLKEDVRKDRSREKAIELLPPQYHHYFKRKKDHDRAEAALIALWCKDNYGL